MSQMRNRWISDQDDLHLILMWNCVPAYADRPSAYLLEHLGHRRYQWPSNFHNLQIYDLREIVVHLQPGLSIEARTANVMISILALVRGNVGLLESEAEKCGVVESRKPTAGLRRSVAVLVRERCGPHVFWRNNLRYPQSMIDTFLDLRDLYIPLTRAFHKACILHIEEIRQHQRGHRNNAAKHYERNLERAVHCLKHLQRIQHRRDAVGAPVPLVRSPIQLGYCCTEQWLELPDDCKNMSKRRKLADLLATACDCGLVTWKLREVSGQEPPLQILAKDWLAVMTHQLKEQAVQRFMRGNMILDATGEVAQEEETTARKKAERYTIITLDDQEGLKTRPECVRHHMCFILPLEDGKQQVTEFMNRHPNLSDTSNQASLEKEVLSADVIAAGELQMCTNWEGVGRKFLRLDKTIQSTGRVRVLVGEYCGPEHHAIQVLHHAAVRPTHNAALCDYFAMHCSKDLQEANWDTRE